MIAIGLASLAVAIVGAVLGYVVRANGRNWRELQNGQKEIVKGIERVADGQREMMEIGRRVAESQREIMEIGERVADGQREIMKRVGGS